MQVATGKHGGLRVTRQRLAPVFIAVDGQHRTTGRPRGPVTTAQRGPDDAEERQ